MDKTEKNLSTRAPLCLCASMPLRLPSVRRRGQTAVEYLLVTAALTTAFILMYGALQWYLKGQFTSGGVIILRMYTQAWD